MFRSVSLTLSGLPLLVLLLIGSDSHAGSPIDAEWRAEALPRLQAIYDRGAFSTGPFGGIWLADSSGYLLREVDPETKDTVLRKYPVGDDEPTIADRADAERLTLGSALSPDGERVLEIHREKLTVRPLPGGERTRLTDRPADRDIEYRDPVWSPDGTRVAFIEEDSTDVRQRAVPVPVDPSYPGVRYDRFARVGERIESLRVGVVEVDAEQVPKPIRWLPLDVPEEGFYLGQITWAGNSNELTVETMSRFRDVREFYLVPLDGEPQRIYREKNEAWAIGSQEIASGLDWIEDGKKFIVVSEKDGWRHAFLHERNGKQLAVLTPGEYDMIDRAFIDETAGWYYFYASPEDGTRKFLYRVPLDGSGTLERITPENTRGWHDYRPSPDRRFAFHTHSTIDSPPVTELVTLPEHHVVRTLEANTEAHAEAKRVITRPTEFLKLDIDGGISMDAWLIKPRDFDPAKKYPLFIYVYGEPYAQTVLDRWGVGQTHFHRVVADLGYIVVSIDNRGTPSPKGAAWRRSIFGSLGPLSTEEQAAGLKELGRMRSYLDLSRVGIWGWSGGGSNTLNALFRKPELYHVGIAVVPKPQPHLYNAWFQEIYMRDRTVNPEGYKRSAPLNFAEGLKGHLLIITGSGETNTHIQIIEGLVDRLVELGKPFDYMVYPYRDHGLREGRGTVVHVRMRIIRYLIDHLPAGGQFPAGPTSR